MPANNPVQMAEVDCGQQPEIDLRVAEGAGVAREYDVAGDGQCHTAAAGGAVDGRDGGLAQGALCLPEFDVKLLHEEADFLRRLAQQQVQVESRAEAHRESTPHNDRAH